MLADNTEPPPSDKTPVSGSNSVVICCSKARNVASPSSAKMSASIFRPLDDDGVGCGTRPRAVRRAVFHDCRAEPGAPTIKQSARRLSAQVRGIHGLGRT